MEMQSTEVVDVPEEGHYAIRVNGEQVGLASYEVNNNTVTFTHTEISPEHRDSGVGGQLVQGALDDVRDRRLAVEPQCTFVRHWIDEHQEYADLVGP